MQVAVSAPGTFHSFHLARELLRRNALAKIFTTYPRFKLRGEGISQQYLSTFPWLHTPYLALRWRPRLGPHINQQWEWLVKSTFDHYVSRQMPFCEVFVGLSGSSLSSGLAARANGSKYVCDRGSAHIRRQDELLRLEHEFWEFPYLGIDPRVIDQEEAEYAASDCVTVPSTFALRSFIDLGVPQEKLRLLPYGVDLQRFKPMGEPPPGSFGVLFVGAVTLQKGVQYLLQAYKRLRHPRKSLTLVGSFDGRLMSHLRAKGLWDETINLVGHLPKDQLPRLYSSNHVCVLPSVQDGFGMVLAEAMACGRPVIASMNSGGPDLLQDGREGFLVPTRDSQSLLDRLQLLADSPSKAHDMGRHALQTVQSVGGWKQYGEAALDIYSNL